MMPQGKQLTGRDRWTPCRKDSSHLGFASFSGSQSVCCLQEALKGYGEVIGLPGAASPGSGLLLSVLTADIKIEDPVWLSKQGKDLRHPSLATLPNKRHASLPNEDG